MRLILVRHGETEENKADIMQGWLPGKLTSLGIKQAQQLAERLKWLKIEVAYSSDLARCVDTAKEILKFHLHTKLILDKRLREVGHGKWDGRKHSELDWSSLPGEKWNNRAPGGESFEEVLVRVKDCYREILKKGGQKTVLIVSHGGIMKLLQGILQKKTIQETVYLDNPKNTCVTEFLIDSKGKATLVCLNCEKHLQ